MGVESIVRGDAMGIFIKCYASTPRDSILKEMSKWGDARSKVTQGC